MDSGEIYLSRHRHFFNWRWILIVNLLLGIYVLLPFMAPVFMHFGYVGAAKAIYFIYSWLCHQLPERSFFLFGSKLTYSLAEIQNAWQSTTNPTVLRQFIGDSAMGWKVAWSDRMVSMYGSILVLGLIWWPIRHRIKPLPWWGLVLLLMPMAVDGTSHFVSDVAGIGQGFRDSNLWLAELTHQALPANFYSGDAWGSFNSVMCLLTGVLFGLGIVWFAYPYMDFAFTPKIQSSHVLLSQYPPELHDKIHL